MKQIYLAILLSLGVLFSSCGPKVINSDDLIQGANDDLASCGKTTQKVIYGTDDRKEYYQSGDKIKTLSKSVGALVSTSRLKESTEGDLFTYSTISYASAYDLCESEPFRAQNILPFCSSFLIAPDIMVTAGHCILDNADCGDISVVFDYSIESSSATSVPVGPKSFSSSNVYSCKAVLARSQGTTTGVDYTIFQLDRPVENRLPLKIRRSGNIANSSNITVVGFPMGLPMKIDTNGSVREVSSSYFISNLDTYGGNSGSPIINNITLEVEGILISGEEDLVENKIKVPSCYESKKCAIAGCSGEWATKITALPSTISTYDLYVQATGANDCLFANDGVCDDGRAGAQYAACILGTDQNDCAGIDQNSSDGFSCTL